MSWRRAPLYVRAHDLCCWLFAEAARWEEGPARALCAAVLDDARELLCAISLALTFPAARAEQRQRADERVVRLRVQLRVARELGALSPRRHRFASGELGAIGRMIGGWKRARASPT